MNEIHSSLTTVSVTNITNNTTTSPLIVFDELYSDNVYNSSSELYIYGLDKQSIVTILYGFIAFSVLTVFANIVVIKSTNSTRGGQSTFLVFIRSLSVSDVLTGLFGIFKSFQLQNIKDVSYNCFLPESIFVSASTASCFTFVWLNMETYLRLAKPFCSVMRMDKHNTIVGTVFMWNMSFIVGFLPQMGLSDEEFVCNLFLFYSAAYIGCVNAMWLISILCVGRIQVLLNKTRNKIEERRQFVSPHSLEYKQYKQLCVLLHTDSIIHTLCYLPFMTYIIFYFISNQYLNNNMANINLIFFLPVFLMRSFLTALLHRYRIVKIQKLTCDTSRTHDSTQCEANVTNTDEILNTQVINNATPHSNTSAVYTISGTTIQSTKPHEPVSAQVSNITMVTEEEELSLNDDTKL